VHPDVRQRFPQLRVQLVVATGLANAGSWPDAESALAAAEADAAAGALTWSEDDPAIASWHAAYRAFGTNPRRVRPSVDALGRRLAKKGSLPRINPAVDAYNLVSVRHALPAGAFDLDRVFGDVDIRHADGTESFTPLGEPDSVETPKPGEVVYVDAAGVLTRHWNHRDAHRTRVTEDSTRVAFLLETVQGARDGHLLKAAAELRDLLAPHAADTAVHHLGAERPEAAV
jgi:DNA/RNA-binding domain of Phe-tRNA-synthetase-like protein